MVSSDAASLIAQCRWPNLSAPYAEALRDAVCFILERFPDTLGIIVSGTIVRGNPAPSSDLDIYVIRRKLQQQRIQKFFRGVPAEIFVNPAAKVLDYFERERKAAQPITAHMLSTGFVILNLDPVIDDLRARARRLLDANPDPDDEALTIARYMVASRYEDATDIATERPETSRMILDLAVHDMVRYRFLAANRYIPRAKDLLDALNDLDETLSDLVRRFYAAATMEACLSLAEQIADNTIHTRGFFEWESTPAEVIP